MSELDDAALDAIERRHRKINVQVGSRTHGGGPQYGDVCAEEGTSWPCTTARLAAEVRRLRAQTPVSVESVAVAIYKAHFPSSPTANSLLHIEGADHYRLLARAALAAMEAHS